MATLNIKKNPFVLLLFATIILLVAFSFRPVGNVGFEASVMFGIPVTSMVWLMPLFLLSFLVGLPDFKEISPLHSYYMDSRSQDSDCNIIHGDSLVRWYHAN